MSMLAIIARGVSSRPWLAGLIAPAVLLGAGTFQRLLAGVRDASPARRGGTPCAASAGWAPAESLAR